MPRTHHTDETRAADQRYRREWYARNAEHAKARVVERRNAIKAWFRAHRATLKCAWCPEADPACLDFHHDDPTQKEQHVAKAVRLGWSIERIESEMRKCIILCANCHRKHHAADHAPLRRVA